MGWLRAAPIALILVAAAVQAAPAHRTARAALEAWRSAARTGDAQAVAALVPEGATVLVHPVGGPGGDRTLDGPGLRAALEKGEWNALGLDRHLLLPRAQDLREDGARIRAADARCPEVTWIFAKSDGAWRLVEIVRTYLAC